MIMKIGIIGTGKVAHQLAYAFSNVENISIDFVYGRSIEKAERIIKKTACSFLDSLEILPPVELVIVAISDDHIKDIIHRISEKNDCFIVHTSGVKDIDILHKFKNHGILYPLYSFYNKKEISLKNVPFLLEASSKENLNRLSKIANCISNSVHSTTSEQKKFLHIAAVYANNFSNHMMTKAFDILEEKEISMDLLSPIIQQSCENWKAGNAKQHQSGPAKRRDNETMLEHQQLLNNDKERALYKLISQSISRYYS